MKRSYKYNDFLFRIGKVDFKKKLTQGEYVEYCNTVGSFALLNSCFKADNLKTSVPYAWELSIGESIYIGRTMEEFKELMDCVKTYFQLGDKKQIIIFDTNISYNFHAFIKHTGDIKNLFAKEEHQPIVYSVNGLMFRDFNILVGEKLISDCFYTTEIITENSRIGIKETNILLNVAETINDRIKEEFTVCGGIVRLPLTNTGRARKVLSKLCNDPDYRELIYKLTLEPGELKTLKEAFSGGLVISADEYKNKELNNVSSFDLISSYLSSVCSRQFPMSKGELIKISSMEEASSLEKDYVWVGYVKFTGLLNKYPIGIISVNNAYNLKGYSLLNNKIATAQEVILPLTNVDFNLIKSFYYIKSVKFGVCYRYKKDYLPKAYIEKCLGFYKDKTELKGIPGKEIEYTVKKCILNASCFGVMVQNPLSDDVTYNNGKWERKTYTIEEHCDRYNSKKGRFAWYPWGVFVSAYSRETLLNGILYILKSNESDYVYSDTDSIKLLNEDSHIKYFQAYNEWIAKRIDSVCEYYGIDKELSRPKTINGKTKQLGAWELDGRYPVFETSGEKRYISINEDGEFEVTISGVNSKKASEYMGSLEDVFLQFGDEYFTIPKEYTGRMSVYLIKTERRGIIKDRDGEEHAYYTRTGVFQEESDYCMGLTDILTCMCAERRTI